MDLQYSWGYAFKKNNPVIVILSLDNRMRRSYKDLPKQAKYQQKKVRVVVKVLINFTDQKVYDSSR